MNRYYNCQIKYGSLLQKQNIVFKDEEQKKQRSSFLMLMPLVVSSFCTKYNDYILYSLPLLSSCTYQLQPPKWRTTEIRFLLPGYEAAAVSTTFASKEDEVASATTTASFFPSDGQISLTMLDATQIDNRTRIDVKCSKNQYSS